MGKWYAGVVHSHTNRSDGIFSPAELIKKAEEKGLDFIIITDHDRFCDPVPVSDKILVIPGTELSKHGGHTNIWGLSYPFDDFECETYEEWQEKISEAKKRGAVVCINHPKCSNCTWRWPLEPEKADCVEVWNSPQHTDNMICTEWWREQLAEGKRIPAVGGSDFHRDYVVTDLLDNPVTCVYAENCTQEEILAAIKAGRTTVSPHVGMERIEITCGDKMLGDTVKLTKDTKITVKTTRLKKGHTLKVFGKNGVIFSLKARRTGPFSVTLPVKDTNFVCAQIDYELNTVYAFVYKNVVGRILSGKENAPLPPFIYAQTGAMYFE